MIELTLNEFLRISEGELISGYKDVLFKGVSTDTRDLTPGEAFFALKGENFDGHDFVQEAFNNGAAVAVVEQSIGHISEDYPIIKVGSTLQALQKLAEWWRRRFDIPVIGITGSSGKTTTKDILSSILEVKMNVHKTWGNFNNEIGVPLTLLGLDNHHDVCVVEMAMRGLGEIWELCGIAYPTMGIITNIGSAHYERLGSMENIAKAKGELARSIPQGGLVMLNGDDRWSSYIAVITAGRVMSYGFGEGAQLRARKIKSTSTGTIFTFDYQNGSHAMRLPLLGRHNVYNCLASMGIALDLGLTIHEIQEGLDGVKLTGMRLERTAGIRGATIINDTYNANPSSMLASLEVLKEFRNMRTIAVLGDMLELGNIAPQKHREIGEAVVRLGINLLVTVGKLGEYIAEAAIAEGMSPDNMFITYDNKEAISYLRDILGPGDVLLIKGSRMLGMEDMVRNLEEPGS